MSAMQGWATTVKNLMRGSEDTMEVLGIPKHHKRDRKGRKGAQPEQKEPDVSRLPGHELADWAHASEVLRKIKAQFQNVSCLLRECCAVLRKSCLLLQRQPGPGGASAGAMPLGRWRVVCYSSSIES